MARIRNQRAMIRNDVEYAAVQDRPISHEIKPPLEFQVELVASVADLEAVLATCHDSFGQDASRI